MDETTLSRFTGHYQAALRDYLAPGAPDGLSAAQELGNQAVSLKLEILDLARLHEAALTTVPGTQEGAVRRAALTAKGVQFFTEALAPLEATHPSALASGTALAEMNANLVRNTADLADSRRALKEGVSQRQDAELALQTSEEQSARLLAEADELRKHLQDLAHRILAAQEEERRKMSLTLHDEIAQTLLGIHVRLLALKGEVTLSTAAFENEIATTQRLVQESVQTINRFALEWGIEYEN